MPKGVDVAWPWNTHSSTPASLRTTWGTLSFHFSGTWLSYMSGGSTMWSSMLTRIMSSICTAVPPEELGSRVPIIIVLNRGPREAHVPPVSAPDADDPRGHRRARPGRRGGRVRGHGVHGPPRPAP